MDQRRLDPFAWGIVFIGALCGCALGALLAALFRNRGNGVTIYNVFGQDPNAQGRLPAGGPIKIIGAPVNDGLGGPEMLPTLLTTITLSTTSVSRLATAIGHRPWKVRVRTIGPAGSFAFVSTERTVFTPGVPPVQCAMTIPAGSFEDIRIVPPQALFAVGNVANTIVSVTASEEIT